MSFLQQLINYLSQPPDSIVYHVVTLLALQVTLGLAWWQVRLRPDDDFARRLAWASGAILLSRLLILLAFFATSDLIEAVTLLPPLERAVDTLAVALLVWALAPQPRNLPYLNSALLIIVTIVIAIMYFAFAIEWRSLVQSSSSNEGYAVSQQAFIWSILQTVLLSTGAALILLVRERQWSLRLAIVAVLLVAQGLSLALAGSVGPTNVEVSFWSRMGNIIAYPMLAILAYRHNLRYLLPAGHLGGSVISTLVESLSLSSDVSSSLQPDQTLEQVLTMVSGLLPAQFIAVARVSDKRPQHFHVTALVTDYNGQPSEAPTRTRNWVLRRDDWPFLTTILHDRNQVELLSDGPGARNLYELNRELELGKPSSLLIQPLGLDSVEVGLLLIAGATSQVEWSEDEKALTEALGTFLAQSLNNAQRYQLALAGQAPEFEQERAILATELEQIAHQRDQALEQSIELSEQLAVARERLDGDHRKLRETTQALAMAVQRQTRVRQLEKEIVSLREALSEAELALASAAAGEAGLSTEWVMRTVTRYSGELEEAQARIMALEERMIGSNGQETLEQAARLTGKLRTPLTALGGYTDLLLDQETGKISAQQESLLRRMRVNVDNMTHTVEAISTAARLGRHDQVGEVRLNVHELIEEAILAVSPKLEANKLLVDIDVEDGLPALSCSIEGVRELLAEALNAACLVSVPDSHLRISANHLLERASSSESPHESGYMRVSFSDNSGDYSHQLYSAAILQQGITVADREPSESSDLADVLDKISRMVSSKGGRSWLELSQEAGGTLHLLLPLTNGSPVNGDSNQ